MILYAEKLADVHPDLRAVILAAAQKTDILVAVGHRDQAAQLVAFQTGKSEVNWPHSKHNALPSLAVDVCPVPLDWNDAASFARMADVIKQTAQELGIEIVYGGDWKRFRDADHFELLDGIGGTDHGGTVSGGSVSA